MLRTILGVVAGVVSWWVLAAIMNFGLHAVWPAYAAADTPAMMFSLSMKLARLTESSIASILAALIAQRVAPRSEYAVAAYGFVLFVIFLPVHYMLFARFPVWYHAYFLISLMVLPLLTVRVIPSTLKAAPLAS
jgi:hypothetical protein